MVASPSFRTYKEKREAKKRNRASIYQSLTDTLINSRSVIYNDEGYRRYYKNVLLIYILGLNS